MGTPPSRSHVRSRLKEEGLFKYNAWPNIVIIDQTLAWTWLTSVFTSSYDLSPYCLPVGDMTNIHSMEISISYGNLTMLISHGNWLHAHFARSMRLLVTTIQSRLLDMLLESEKKKSFELECIQL